jgi:nitrogenase molybdenum-iron protein NifN
VFFTRHFNDPIAIQTTAVNDVTAVFDGGEFGVTTAVENITKKVTPKLIGLYSTGLTETKGDDLRGVVGNIDFPIVWTNTPDYEGAFETGFANATKALIETLTVVTTQIEPKKLTVIPNVSITPIELEKIKEFFEDLGFRVNAIPDLSNSLDGYLGQKQGSISSGGIDVEDIKQLANNEIIVSIGASVKECADALLAKNPNAKLLKLNSLMGLQDIDDAIAKLLELGVTISEKLKRARNRYLDAMLDAHFVIGKESFIVAGENDYVYGACRALREVGAQIICAVVPLRSTINELIEADEVIVGDLEDARKRIDGCGTIISNFHAIALAKKYHKNVFLRGFPLWEVIGSSAICDSLYDGGMRFLFEVNNSIELHHLLHPDSSGSINL